MGVSIWEGSKAQELIAAIEQTNKIDKQQGTANAGKALVVGNDGIVVPMNNGITSDIKIALLNCFQNVAWVNQQGQNYYDALQDALYAEATIVRIDAVFTQGDMIVRPETPLNDLKANLVVTGYYNDGTSHAVTNYTLSGTLVQGTSTITVTAEEKTDTFTVTVSAPYWDYTWDATSETLPEGMTVISGGEYNFTTEPGYMWAKGVKLDFDYVGDGEIEVEFHCFTYHGGSALPAVSLQVAQDKSATFKANVETGSKYIYYKVQDGNYITTTIDAEQPHKYNLKSTNGSIVVSVDGNVLATGLGFTRSDGTAFSCDQTYEVCYLKSIRFRRES